MLSTLNDTEAIQYTVDLPLRLSTLPETSCESVIVFEVGLRCVKSTKFGLIA